VDGSQQVQVLLGDYFFSPRSLSVSTGTTVVWNYSESNGDVHTVTSENQTEGGRPVFASPNLRPGDMFSYAFKLPGVYRYFCAFHHSLMRNVWVNVTGPPLGLGGDGHSTLILVATGIGSTALAAALTVFLVRRRRSSAACWD
jgi:plastocyanin